MPDRLKTSLGIWALGGMITRFVPVGYQPEHGSESTADKVRRAVDGLGDLMDDYEFHYPYELSRDNLDEVREALDGHGIYCLASGLHLDPRNGKGGLSSPDDAVRDEALRVTLDACEFAGEIDAHFIIWPGIEGYNYPFQTPYRESWARFIDGVGQAATALAGHGKKLFLEHKNSEPAMKIFMRNIGMTLHVIHKLRAEGIDNVQVNMDWQHLLMNGEHLPEYAALLAAEGLLGHQHANSGWGIFDDDNMVGATAFMETVELAHRAAPRRLRRQRRAPGLRPLPVHRGPGRGRQALGRAVALHRRGRAAHRRRRPARGAAAQGRRRRLRARLRRAGRARTVAGMTRLLGLDVGTSSVKGIAIDERRRRAGRRRARLPAVDAASRLERAGPRGLVARRGGGARGARRRQRGGHRAVGPDARPRRARRGRPPAAPRDPVERRAHAGAVRRDRASASASSASSS